MTLKMTDTRYGRHSVPLLPWKRFALRSGILLRIKFRGVRAFSDMPEVDADNIATTPTPKRTPPTNRHLGTL